MPKCRANRRAKERRRWREAKVAHAHYGVSALRKVWPIWHALNRTSIGYPIKDFWLGKPAPISDVIANLSKINPKW